MTAVGWLRYAVLLAPLALLAVAGLLGGRTPQDRRREWGAALLAGAAAAIGLAALHHLALVFGWWRYAAVEGSIWGLPVDLWLGWSVLWGAVPVFVRRVPVPVLLAVLAWVDVLAMPRLSPLVVLGDRWLLGEAAGLALVALPVLLLGRWTVTRRRLAARATLQVAVFGGLSMWLLPTVAITLGDGSWDHLLALPAPWLAVIAQVALLLALPGLSAVREFATRGGGTPFPWDPPQRLVTTGPYAYVANPMQLSCSASTLLIAALTHSLSTVGAAAMTVAFSVAIAAVHERDDLTVRLGAPWLAYREHVRDWLPRTTPHVTAEATLFLARACDPCDQTRVFVEGRHPVGLRIAAAESYPPGAAPRPVCRPRRPHRRRGRRRRPWTRARGPGLGDRGVAAAPSGARRRRATPRRRPGAGGHHPRKLCGARRAAWTEEPGSCAERAALPGLRSEATREGSA
ncbi:protein-S-isoprenylcysteine O-methyltransferase Ste14 [Allocatelliglobosispora scoriae]|uniref:Protein-S-isoprenylcysteine O-methyltransferase Ste14 n=1 Tax=Allocatelliglobosispora scoriae TaxID=643052 RepID=A0A841BII0_9ACTN|nr:methyltransferase [Allocatelliglobosispora scoriae]MBB5866996.1 protein-S-isoprenylcysteine O-methyltransferase Ste14 [Allocatelliglobosispora scoriae]